MAIINQNILADEVFIYPSSNASDGGELNTEENLSALSDKFAFKSFVLKRFSQAENGLTLSVSGKTVNITKGECFIDGRYINLDFPDDVYTLDLEHTYFIDEPSKTIFDYINIKYYLMVVLREDATGCVRADLMVNNDLVSGGVQLMLSTTTDPGYPNLLLGSVTATDSSTLVVEENPNKYCIIDIEQIGSSEGSISDWLVSLVADALDGLYELTLDYNTEDTSPGNLTPRLILKHGTETLGWIRNTNSGVEIYYKDNATGKTANLLVTPTDIAYTNSTGTLNIISAIKTLQSATGINVAPKSGTTSTSQGTTYNGTSDSVARADHYHQGYIRNKASGTSNQDTQTINTVLSVENNITATGNISANKVFNAVWNDYADALPKARNVQTEPGDIIAKDEYSEGYGLATSYNAKLVVGVHSDTWGHLLGGTEETLDDYIPVAVAGNVRVKVVGRVKMGDFIVASFIPGVGVATNGYTPGTIVGKALENKDTDDVSRILMQVMLI